MELIGMPKTLTSYQSGSLNWHPSGSIFVGSGISENDIPFSYNADWESAGRWGIEVKTKENTYRLIPLEGLFVCHKKSVEWKEILLDISYPDIKREIAEEIAAMLTDEKNTDLIVFWVASLRFNNHVPDFKHNKTIFFHLWTSYKQGLIITSQVKGTVSFQRISRSNMVVAESTEKIMNVGDFIPEG